jgi:serine/threonine protein phosphatase PrpC
MGSDFDIRKYHPNEFDDVEPVVKNYARDGVNVYTTLQYLGAPDENGNHKYPIQHDRFFVTVTTKKTSERLHHIIADIHAELPLILQPQIKPSGEEVLQPGHTSGTTGLLISASRGGDISVASLGDCRAHILAYNTRTGRVRAIQLTRDQSSNDPEEQARIREAGGDIFERSPGKFRMFRPKEIGAARTDERSAEISSAFCDYDFNGLMGRIPRLFSFNMAQDPINLGDDEIPFLLVETDGAHVNRTWEQRLQPLQAFINAAKAEFDAVKAQTQNTEIASEIPAVSENDTDEASPSSQDPASEVFIPDTEKLAHHFNNAAIDAGGNDNTTVIVARLDLTSIAAGIFDGHGTFGYYIAEEVSKLSQRKIEIG